MNRKTEDGNLGFYFLTAKHCTDGVDFDDVHTLYFNYQSPDGNTNNTATTNRGIEDWQTGEINPFTSSLTTQGYEYRHATQLRLVQDYSWGDFALVEILTPVPPHFNVSFAGWNPSLFHNGIQVGTPTVFFEPYVGIHHPRGDIKKLSTAPFIHWNENPIATDCYTITVIIDVLFGWIWGHRTSTQVICNWMDNPWFTVLGWQHGTTEPGSSGSGMFNKNNKQIGVLSWGVANCDPAFFDNYGKFRSNYFRKSIKNTLNPDNDLGVDLVGIDSRKITCYDNLDLPGDPGVSGHYFPANHYQPNNIIVLQATNNITTTQPIRVYSGADFRFRAGGNIIIGPGFTADQGSNVIFEIQGCNASKTENSQQNVRKLLSNINVPKYKKLDLEAISKGRLFQRQDLVIEIFPNPSDGKFKIQLSAIDNYDITIQSVSGSIIARKRVEHDNETDINLQQASGLYFIIVQSKTGAKVNGKIILR